MEEVNYENSLSKDITDQKLIEKLLDNLKLKNKNNEYLAKLSLYYPILSPSICQKYNVKKIKTEKEILFDIINDLIDNFVGRF